MENLWPEELKIDSSKEVCYYWILEEQSKYLLKLTQGMVALNMLNKVDNIVRNYTYNDKF